MAAIRKAAPAAPEGAAGSRPDKNKRRQTTWVSEIPTLLAALFRHLWKLAVRYRWQLTPVIATLLVFVAAETPGAVLTSFLSAAAAGGLRYAAKTERSFRGRKFLSNRERETASLWLFVVSIWSLVVLLPLPVLVEAVLLVAATGYADYRWWTHRVLPKPKKLSKEAMEMLARWEEVASRGTKLKITEEGSETVAKDGQHPLAGSKVVRASVVEPAPGAISFRVQLRDDVHGSDAVGDASRKLTEAVMKLPADCAQLLSIRTDSTQIQVTLSPERHLEQSDEPWPGPEVTAEGEVPIARTPTGETVVVKLWDKDGVFHGRCGGGSGGGKSNDGRVVCSAAIATGYYSVWMIDGGYGQSMSDMGEVFDLYAVDVQQWKDGLDALYSVQKDRQRRRGRLRGKDAKPGWYVGKEEDPTILAWMDEAPEIKRHIGKKISPVHKMSYDDIALSILQNGRKCGISLVQLSQDPFAQNLLGGAPARNRMARGFEILHRPGGKMEQSRNQDSGDSDVKINLLALPGEPAGFAGVQFQGKIIAHICRVRYAKPDDVAAWAETITPRSLTGADLIAAGKEYARRNTDVIDPADAEWGSAVADMLNEEGVITLPGAEEGDDEQELDVRSWIMKSLTLDGSATVGELVERGGGARGRKRRNLSIWLGRLSEDGVVHQIEGSQWAVTEEEK